MDYCAVVRSRADEAGLSLLSHNLVVNERRTSGQEWLQQLPARILGKQAPTSPGPTTPPRGAATVPGIGRAPLELSASTLLRRRSLSSSLQGKACPAA